MECNFLKKSGRICRIILFGLLSAIGCQADYDDTFEAIVMKEHDKDKNILTILKYFSIDWIKKTCWKEIVNLAGYEVTTLIEAVEASDNSISGMLLATGEFVQCGYQSHMALFPLLKTARVASGENF
jgi:hypothetical protein